MVRISRLLVVALLPAAYLLGGCSDSHPHDGAPTVQPVAVVTAGAATKDLFLYGSVLRDGKPVVGAQVAIELSDEKAEQDAKIGENIPMFGVPIAVTDRDGTYAVRISPDVIPTRYYAGGTDRSTLNFEVDVSDDRGLATWNSTVFPVGHPKVWRAADTAAPADDAVKMVFDLGTQKIATTDSDGETEKADLPVQSIK